MGTLGTKKNALLSASCGRGTDAEVLAGQSRDVFKEISDAVAIVMMVKNDAGRISSACGSE